MAFDAKKQTGLPSGARPHDNPIEGHSVTASYFFFAVLVFLAGAFFLHAPQLTRPTSLLEENLARAVGLHSAR